MSKPHLLLIDAHNLIRRVYGGNPQEDSVDKAEGAINTVRHSFNRAIETHQPTHCCWAFDSSGEHTWRHELFEGYKKGRSAIFPPLADAIRGYRLSLTYNGWCTVSKTGYEADDIIVSLTLMALALGWDVTVLSYDKDLAWLHSQGAKVYNHFERCYHDEAWCEKKHGVRTDQLLDYLALTGDTTDGIPGVPGIGVKTAAALLDKYGTLAGALADAPKSHKALVTHADKATLSLQLTTPDKSCMLGYDLAKTWIAPKPASAN